MTRFAPLLLFGLLCAALFYGLAHRKDSPASSVMLGKPFPALTLQQKNVGTLLAGRVTLVNFFASWCLPCTVEQPALLSLKQKNIVPMIGIAWKNRPDDVKKWLALRGDPYTHVLLDERGTSTVLLALTGVPETFIVDRKGIIVFHTKEPITQELLAEKIIPLLEGLQR